MGHAASRSGLGGQALGLIEAAGTAGALRVGSSRRGARTLGHWMSVMRGPFVPASTLYAKRSLPLVCRPVNGRTIQFDERWDGEALHGCEVHVNSEARS